MTRPRDLRTVEIPGDISRRTWVGTTDEGLVAGTAAYRLDRPVSSIAAVRLTGPAGARLAADAT
jgi:hypothetical protein